MTTVETEANRRLAEGTRQATTGGDPFELDGCGAITSSSGPLTPSGWAGNHLPAIRGTDLGIWRRIVLLYLSTSRSREAPIPEAAGKAGQRSTRDSRLGCPRVPRVATG